MDAKYCIYIIALYKFLILINGTWNAHEKNGMIHVSLETAETLFGRRVSHEGVLEWRYGAMNSYLGTICILVSSSSHFTHGNKSPIQNEQGGWGPATVWMGQQSLLLPGLEHRSSSPQAGQYTVCIYGTTQVRFFYLSYVNIHLAYKHDDVVHVRD